MPRGDGTGPAGQGPRTGRGLGPCAGRLRQSLVRGPGLGAGQATELTGTEQNKSMWWQLLLLLLRRR